MPTFTYDGKTIPFEPGETIITAAYKEGIEIPHYCWHPGLSAPANCRMCLVEILPKPGARAVMLDVLELDPATGEYKPRQKPKLLPACQIAASEGIEVKGDTSEHVLQARKGVQELLLLNHPVDCPICDQSGECKLQDYWLEHGQYQKRRRDEPVHKPKGVEFGPTIVYDAERCVMCTRCIRFMEEVAKDPVLDMRERGNLNEVFVAPGRKLEGHYTFMTEQVCPVGALTTKDFRFKARVWFLRTAKTVCQGCATGCNAHLDYDPRNNTVYRYRPRENMQVNTFWMCDEGMLSYKRAHQGRITDPRVGEQVVSTGQALDAVKSMFEGVNGAGVAVVLSAQYSLEDNWALKELGRLLGSRLVYGWGAHSGYEDDILIHKDKNPNSYGVRELAPDLKPISDLVAALGSGRVTHAIMLGGASGQNIPALRGRILTIAAHEGPLAKAAEVVLPATSWAEHHGTYVNFKGIRQQGNKAIEPQGASRPAWQQVAAVATALGLEPTWSKLKEIRAALGIEVAPPPRRSLPVLTGVQSGIV